MPVLALPLGLAALAAVAIPLLIHLARRTETVPTDFAALRWLRQKPRPRHRPRFDEILLLAIRLLLIALLALWLARPVLPGSADRRAVTAFVPGVATPGEGDGRRVWLAPGFPSANGPAPSGALPVASLIRQLDAELPAGVPLTIVAPAELAGVDAQRPRLSHPVSWRVAAGRSGSMPTSRTMRPIFAVRHASERAGTLRYWRAVRIAWGLAGPGDAATVDRPVPVGTRYLVWMAGGPLPIPVRTWIEAGGTALVATDAEVTGTFTPMWRDGMGEPLAAAARLGGGRVVRLTRDLTPAAMPELVSPTFPEEVARLLAPAAPPSRVMARDHAPLTGGSVPAEPMRDLRLPLALAIAALWFIERWLATARRRSVAR